MTFPDEVLMAYADGELDAGTRAAIEAAMDSDPAIARRIAQHRALRGRVQSAFDRILEEPVPARLLEAARSAPGGAPRDNIVPLRRPMRRWSWPQWTAVAASLLVGVVAGRLAALHPASSGPIATRGGTMLASGVLAQALSDQLASAQAAAEPVRIGVSFRSRSGEYCRTFVLRTPALAGLACRSDAGWRIGVLARAESPAGVAGAYRQAASSMPPALVAAVGAEIAGEPLDAAAEAAARARRWRP
jgi:hypothetical protein